MRYLNLVPLRAWLIVILLALASIGLAGFVHYEREIGRRNVLLSQSVQREKAAQTGEAQWKGEAFKLKGVIRDAKPVLAKATIRYRTLRDTLRLTDTVEVKAVLAAADDVIEKQQALIHVLGTVIDAQDSALSASDRRAAALQEQNALIRKSIPGRASKFGSALKLAGVAVLAFEAGKHL